MPVESEAPFEADLDIARMAIGGDGVGRLPDGRAVFVPGVAPGDRVHVLIDPSAGTSPLRASLLGLLRPSEARTEPRCTNESCGGCLWKHIDIKTQWLLKRELLADALQRIGGITLSEEQMLPLRHGMLFWGYRHRARVHGGAVGGRWRIGFYGHHSHSVVPFETCPNLVPELNMLIAQVVEALESRDARIESLEAAWSAHENRGAILAHMDAAVRALASSLSQIEKEIVKLKSASVAGRSGELRSYGDRSLRYSHRAAQQFELFFMAGVFTQVNPEINDLLVQAVLERAGNLHDKLVLDLYAGIGNFSIPLALAGAQVTAVELDADAVAYLRRNAEGAKVAVTVQ
jgi:23S rRNA (uracil1939-C5)-methyltransferase